MPVLASRDHGREVGYPVYALPVPWVGTPPCIYASFPPFVGRPAQPGYDSYLTAGGCTLQCVSCFTLLTPGLKEGGLPEEEKKPFHPENKPSREQKQA